jgi:predicted Ser/Thr protein kinase
MPAGAPEGLCPNCLFKVGLESQSHPPVQPSTAPATKNGGFVPPTPQELNAHFPQLEFLELLGKGGMGAVYKARQKSLDRFVAVKILPPDVNQDPAFADRFTREAKALAKLNHPHIVGVHDFGKAGEFYYFVMEYVDGVNVRQALRAAQLKPAEALQIVPQVCDALQYAHEEKVVHRDIKPENILIDKRGRVKIADFGLAKLLGKAPEDLTLTGTKQIVGTVPYMAPEQIEGARDVDHRADIYSLGVTFYEMLTGELPLGRFAPPSKKVQIDVRLDDVVLRTLEKEPQLRYQQAGQVKEEVESISRTPPGKPFTAVMKDVAVQVAHGSKKAAGWVAGKMTGAGKEVQQAAEKAAKETLPQEDGGAWKRILWLWGLTALAVLGVLLDLFRRHFTPLGVIGGLSPLAVFAWKERHTALGRQAKFSLLALLAFWVAMQIIWNSLEAIFIAAIVTVVCYLFWDRLRAWWTKPKAAAPEPPPAEK